MKKWRSNIETSKIEWGKNAEPNEVVRDTDITHGCLQRIALVLEKCQPFLEVLNLLARGVLNRIDEETKECQRAWNNYGKEYDKNVSLRRQIRNLKNKLKEIKK